ncbi:MAG: hypothetical protein N2447_07425, partial [Thermoanaerobaculum sp.]|nr:hypothetical protein [Thermoanaerobaculum sp.]
RKTTGLIVDFVGVFENLERALAFESRDVSGVVQEIDVLRARFQQLMEKGRREFLPLVAAKVGDKAAEALLEHFRDKDRREAFYQFFRELEEVYEILSPDPFLRPYLEDYQRLVEMYRLLRAAYEPHVPVDKSFLRKTAEIVQQYSRTTVLREPMTTYEIGPAALIALFNEEKPDTVKVFNLLKELHRLVEKDGRVAPYLLSIGERAEEIRRRFEERQIQSQEALAELDELVQQLIQAHAERNVSSLSQQAFAVEWWLRMREVAPESAKQVAQAMETAFAEFPHWIGNQRQEGGLRSRLYKALHDIGVPEVVAWADDVLNLLRRAAE